MVQFTMFLVFFLLSEVDLSFRDPDLPIDERVDIIVNQLTPVEKVNQLMDITPGIERLGIPPYNWWNEALHGVARAGRATVFPQAIAMAATFDPDELEKSFSMVSDEARASYHKFQKTKEYDRYKGLTFWTPNINIFRDPRWGRGQETYGEDPFLTSTMGLSIVKGLQGDDPKYFKVHAIAKHFAVHSGSESHRHVFDARPSHRDLWTTYLPAFERLVKEGNVQEVMCAYNRFEGDPACGSKTLLTDILRNKWGYKSLVTSDCYAIDDFYLPGHHHTHPNASNASISAIRAGTDIECGYSFMSLVAAVRSGEVNESELDVPLKKLFKARIQLGMFDPDSRVPWAQIPFDVIESKEHADQALLMAEKSIVLLKNVNNTLPLKNVSKIFIAGPNADDAEMQWANYNGFPSKTITILEGIKAKFPNATVVYEPLSGLFGNTTLVSLKPNFTYNEQPGWYGEFWNNTALIGEPVASGIVSFPDFTQACNVPLYPGVRTVDYTARFTANLSAPQGVPLKYTLSVINGFRFFINGELVREAWDTDGTGVASGYFNVSTPVVTIVLEYIHRYGETRVNFDLGFYQDVNSATIEAGLANANDADVIIYVGGISPRLEGEEMDVEVPGFAGGDRFNIDIPQIQEDVVARLVALNIPLVYIFCTGSALNIKYEKEHASAILNAWYGGQAGGEAIANILAGDYNPAGRLPLTFYESVDDLPEFENYTMVGRTYRYFEGNPLYSFGFGLSYTKFDYLNASINDDIISVFVQNSGDYDGEEVVQIYVKYPPEFPLEPLLALKGFKRVFIPKGQTTQVDISLPLKSFETYNETIEEMRVVRGNYPVCYGSSSADVDLTCLDHTVQILMK